MKKVKIKTTIEGRNPRVVRGWKWVLSLHRSRDRGLRARWCPAAKLSYAMRTLSNTIHKNKLKMD